MLDDKSLNLDSDYHSFQTEKEKIFTRVVQPARSHRAGQPLSLPIKYISFAEYKSALIPYIQNSVVGGTVAWPFAVEEKVCRQRLAGAALFVTQGLDSREMVQLMQVGYNLSPAFGNPSRWVNAIKSANANIGKKFFERVLAATM